MSAINKRRKAQARKKALQERKDKLKAIFSLKSKSASKKIMAVALGGTLAIGGGTTGGMYVWQEATKDDVVFTVIDKEQIIKRDCTETISLKSSNTIAEGEDKGKVAGETSNQACKQDIKYFVHTDKGTFENDVSWLQGKFDAAKLQDQFEVGKKYTATFYGNDVSGKNVLEAEDYKEPVTTTYDWSDSNIWSSEDIWGSSNVWEAEDNENLNDSLDDFGYLDSYLNKPLKPSSGP